MQTLLTLLAAAVVLWVLNRGRLPRRDRRRAEATGDAVGRAVRERHPRQADFERVPTERRIRGRRRR